MGKTKKIKKPRENQQKTIFGDSLGKPHWQIKKTSREPKNKKNKTFQRMFGLRLMFVFFGFAYFFCFFFGLDLEKTKNSRFFLFLGVCGFRFFLAAQWKTKKNLEFGTGETWADVEADEATFDKKIVRGKLHWEQWCGIVQRGKPQTLVLHRLKPLASKLRAPGPGAVRKVEWKPLAAKWLKDRQAILHTNSAKSYASKISGVLHDRVVHKKKRVKVNGKFKWVAPTYVKIQKHKIPGTKKTLRVKSGTQIVDRCWRYLKERLNINQHAIVGSRLLRIQLRSAQYEYWLRGQDLWTATGSLVKWFMAKS